MKKLCHKSILSIAIIIYFLPLSYSQIWSTDMGDTLKKVCAGCDSNVWISRLFPVKNRLFITGGFTMAGDSYSAGISYWKNSKFYPVNSSNPNLGGWFYDLKYYKNRLYLCGGFQNIDNIENLNRLAKWDGNQWDFVSHDSLDINSFYTMQWHHDTLFLGGLLGLINGINRNYVVQWDGANWLNMENGVSGGSSNVFCSTIFNDQIHIGGMFSSASGHAANNVARWNGQQWSGLSSGLDAFYIQSLYADTMNNLLYAGGGFTLPGETIPCNLAKWDGQNWTRLSEATDSVSKSICNYRGNIYVGGLFKTLLKWNGVNMSIAAYVNNTINTMTLFNDELIIGGYFNQINGLHAFGFARYYEPPDSACLYFAPAIYTDQDTFYFNNNVAAAQLYSNSLHGSSWLWNFGDSGTDTARQPLHNYTAPGHYTTSLTLTEAHCTKTVNKSIIVVDTTTSIANCRLTIAELRIYPNPSSGSVTIEVTGAATPIRSLSEAEVREQNGNGGNELRITNQNSKQIKIIHLKENNCKTEINTKGWAKGTYLCCLVVGGKTVKVEKLVVE